MKQNIGDPGLAVFLGQVQKAVDTPEQNRRMFLIFLTVNLVSFLKQDCSCCW